MLRIILLFILLLVVFVPNTHSEETSQLIPMLVPEIPLSEAMLKGDVALMIESVEFFVDTESDMPVTMVSKIWKKIDIKNPATPTDMTFLIPLDFLQRNARPYYHFNGPARERFTCFLHPAPYSSLTLIKYDSRGRIRAIQPYEPPTRFDNTGFRLDFIYGDEKECQETKAFFRRDKNEEEIGRTEFQYEDGKLARLVSEDSNYFVSPHKTELTYDEHGFLASQAEFNAPDEQEPMITLYFRNHEWDRFGNWTRRDVYHNEQLAGAEKREIYYAGDPLPDIPVKESAAENTESGMTKRKMDFVTSIFRSLRNASEFIFSEESSLSIEKR